MCHDLGVVFSAKHCKSYLREKQNVVCVNGTSNFAYTEILFFSELFTHSLDRHLLRSYRVRTVLGTVLGTGDKGLIRLLHN